MDKLIIIGAGGFSQVVAWLVGDINKVHKKWELIGYIDEDPAKYGLKLYGFTVLGDFDYFYNQGVKETIFAVCSVGNPHLKKRLVGKATEWGYSFTNLIHPSVIMPPDVDMGIGNIICPGNIVSVNAKIGDHVLINYSCTIGHNAVISDYSTILPGANIAGNVTIGTGCNIGSNSSIIQGINIGEWSTIGAGAAVVRDIPPHCTAVGVPARPIKFNENY